ncbi:Uncharacterized conserved protein [Tessaracoccus bendigoensis DSM 12906]|uniref:Uncharacterized conserved protein n=1 Tax=Tessaracoccus bendigoensis DSM 12906 TaxID=1123357 RepID=A0A1M6L9B7_9ACTN|nr:CRISPR system precrRNA processing endoribonuclease RAMP protein Cas6 [Tessaracoccus bendigoensis]SHJ67787.1 Uncharacterized conserved protein [Tessaracoccus bendigoensis DSM 12906]
MLTLWQLRFEVEDERKVFPSGVHALLGKWFQEGAEHHDPKAYSILGLASGEGVVDVLVGLLDGGLADRLALMPPGLPHVFGDDGNQGFLALPPHLVRQAAWGDLARLGPERGWSLELITPLCFRRGSLASPWPDPFKMIASLATRWRLGTGEEPPFEIPDSREILVSYANLETLEMWGTPQNTTERGRGPRRRQVVGAVGDLEWRWAPDTRHGDGADGAAALNRLLGLCTFTGVGAYPQFGMGAVRVSPLGAGSNRK